MRLFKKASEQEATLGVEFGAEGVAFAHIQRPPQGLPHLSHCEFLPAAPEQQAQLLHQQLHKRGLQRTPCNLVLSPGQYQLLLVEAPRVPAAELREALRWRIKDLLHFPAAEAVLDVFLLPEDSTKGGNRMAYVVACERAQITRVLAHANQAQLRLRAIDIGELALRNLALACADTRRGVALVRLGPGGGSVHIVRDQALYLARQFSLNYAAGLLDDLPGDALVLEVQRSLDYFERQMRQPPPAQVLLIGENISADKLTDNMRSALPMSLDLLALEAGLALAPELPRHTLPLCALALGAALRQDTEAQG